MYHRDKTPSGVWSRTGVIPAHLRSQDLFLIRLEAGRVTLQSTVRLSLLQCRRAYVDNCKDDRLFTVHELASTLTVQAVPASLDETTQIISSMSIIPPNQLQGSQFAGAEVLIPKPTADFPTAYIYASNRNVGTARDPRGDSIAIFELVNKGTRNERLQLVNQVFTGLDQIRGMQFGPASRGGERFLIAAGVAGDAGAVILQRTEGGRNMKVVARNTDIPTRTAFVWI